MQSDMTGTILLDDGDYFLLVKHRELSCRVRVFGTYLAGDGHASRHGSSQHPEKRTVHSRWSARSGAKNGSSRRPHVYRLTVASKDVSIVTVISSPRTNVGIGGMDSHCMTDLCDTSVMATTSARDPLKSDVSRRSSSFNVPTLTDCRTRTWDESPAINFHSAPCVVGLAWTGVGESNSETGSGRFSVSLFRSPSGWPTLRVCGKWPLVQLAVPQFVRSAYVSAKALARAARRLGLNRRLCHPEAKLEQLFWRPAAVVTDGLSSVSSGPDVSANSGVVRLRLA